MAQITTAEFAEALGTDARTARKFLRSEEGKGTKVGKGARWGIEKREVASLRKRFNAWSSAQDEVRASRKSKISEAPAPAVIEDEADLSLDDLEGPTEADLADD